MSLQILLNSRLDSSLLDLIESTHELRFFQQDTARRAQALDGARAAEERASGGEAGRERGDAADGAVQGINIIKQR